MFMVHYFFMDEFNKERGHGDGKFSTRGNYFTT